MLSLNEQISAKQKEALKKGRNSEKAQAFKKKLINKEEVDLDGLVDKIIDVFGLSENTKIDKKEAIEEFKLNLTKEDILRYIASKGTKNQKVQELIYKQAMTVAESDSPPLILKEVAKILKK